MPLGRPDATTVTLCSIAGADLVFRSRLQAGFPTVRGDWRLSGPRMTVPSGACISEAWSVPVQNLNIQGPIWMTVVLGYEARVYTNSKSWMRLNAAAGCLKMQGSTCRRMWRSCSCEWRRLGSEQRVLFVCMLSCSYYSIAVRSAQS